MIERYNFGVVIVSGREYRRDLIIFPDRIHSPWWRIEGHALSVDDLPGVLDDPPEFLIVGQGANSGMRVLAETRVRLESAGVKIRTCPTADACTLHNELAPRYRVVTCLHLTC